MAAPTHLEQLSERLNSLERDNRILRWVGAALFVGAIIAVGEGSTLFQNRQRGNQLVAQDLVLKDQSGQVRARLGFSVDGTPMLKFFDENGAEIVGLDTYPDATANLNFNHKQQSRMSLATRPDGSAILQFLDPTQVNATALFSWANGTSGLVMNHEKSRVMMGVQPNGDAGVLVNNQGGAEKVRLGASGVSEQSLGLAQPPMAEDQTLPTSSASVDPDLVGPPVSARALVAAKPVSAI